MENATEKQSNFKTKIITIPNILSFFRICLIPIFVWLYCAKQDYVGTVCVILLSGLTDVADGFIARKWNMISDVGKVLDPIADKLTQAAMLGCLLSRFHFMWVPFILLILKEICMGVSGLLAIRKTGTVYGAKWHGKVNTCLLYAMMLLHIIWVDIPVVVSNITIGTCVVMMLISFALYGRYNLKAIKGKNDLRVEEEGNSNEV